MRSGGAFVAFVILLSSVVYAGPVADSWIQDQGRFFSQALCYKYVYRLKNNLPLDRVNDDWREIPSEIFQWRNDHELQDSEVAWSILYLEAYKAPFRDGQHENAIYSRSNFSLTLLSSPQFDQGVSQCSQIVGQDLKPMMMREIIRVDHGCSATSSFVAFYMMAKLVGKMVSYIPFSALFNRIPYLNKTAAWIAGKYGSAARTYPKTVKTFSPVVRQSALLAAGALGGAPLLYRDWKKMTENNQQIETLIKDSQNQNGNDLSRDLALDDPNEENWHFRRLRIEDFLTSYKNWLDEAAKGGSQVFTPNLQKDFEVITENLQQIKVKKTQLVGELSKSPTVDQNKLAFLNSLNLLLDLEIIKAVPETAKND